VTGLSAGPHADRYAQELRRLYDAAGNPKLERLVEEGERQPRLVKLSDSTISDWLTGKTVPRDGPAIRFLIDYLEGRASTGGRRWTPPPEGWERLRAAAWAEKHPNRGGRVSGSLAGRDDPSPSALGRVIGELGETDALLLEVHQAVKVRTAAGTAPVLPVYLPRPFDDRLRREVARAEAGSRIVVLVGESSTGKTRACWEAIRAVLPEWRVWHPLSPRRPDAIMQALRCGQVGPRTVIWLNEAQRYLDAGAAGEEVAAALQDLLHQPQRGPILVLGSLWPRYRDQLTSPGDDRHAAARQLLELAEMIQVPAQFAGAEVTDHERLIRTDARLRLAVGRADGRICQFLAGAFDLEDRYRAAGEVQQAVLCAAIDAYRLGNAPVLTEAFLRDAAHAYLHSHALDAAGCTWFADAMTYLTKPCHGVPGPLSYAWLGDDRDDTPGERYGLADFLDHIGRAERAAIYPSARFWDAVSRHMTEPTTLVAFAASARYRVRFQRAAALYREAADRGDGAALREFARLREQAGDRDEAAALYREAADRGDNTALRALAWLRETAGDRDGAVALYREAADRGDSGALRELTRLRGRTGARDAGAALYRETAGPGNAATDACEAADGGNTDALGEFAWMREFAWLHESAGDLDRAAALYREVADRGDAVALRELARLRVRAGDLDGAAALYREAADCGDTEALRWLARLRTDTGDLDGAAIVAREAADRGDLNVLRELAHLCQWSGDRDGAAALYREAADRGNADALWALAVLHEWIDDLDGAAIVAREAADRGDLYALAELARLCELAGDMGAAERVRRFGLADDGSPAAPW
jgi:hypothetical protein